MGMFARPKQGPKGTPILDRLNAIWKTHHEMTTTEHTRAVVALTLRQAEDLQDELGYCHRLYVPVQGLCSGELDFVWFDGVELRLRIHVERLVYTL